MKAAEAQDPDDAEPEVHRIDAWMLRYSRWRRRRLVSMAELPLATLTLRTFYLSACILLDGVFLPWIVMALQGGFTFLLFAVLLLPTLAVEAILYRRMTVPQGARTQRHRQISGRSRSGRLPESSSARRSDRG